MPITPSEQQERIQNMDEDSYGFNEKARRIQLVQGDLVSGQDVQENNVDAANPLPVTVISSALPAGAATEATLSAFKTENDSNLDLANASLDAIEADADAIRVAVQSIDTDFDVTLSTRASESTLSTFRTETNTNLNDIEADVEAGNAILTTLNTSTDNIEADIDQIRIQQTDRSQYTRLTDGTDNVAVFTDESLSVSTILQGRNHTYATAAVAKAASATIVTYTPGATKKAYYITVSADGYARWEISYGTTGAETLKKVLQTNPAQETQEVVIDIQLITGQSLKIVGYNNNTAAGNMNMYATVEHE